MTPRIGRNVLLAVAACCLGTAAGATTVWDESVNGELSDSGLAPTPLSFAGGSNVVLGATGNPGTGVDRDYFTFTVPAGGTLTSITILPNTSTAGVSFFGIQAGSIMTVGPNGEGAQDLLAWAHYGTDLIGQNLLAFMNLPGGLAAGPYTVWIQELGGRVDYGFDFNVVAPVPLPAAAWLLASGLLGGFGWMRRRAQRAA